MHLVHPCNRAGLLLVLAALVCLSASAQPFDIPITIDNSNAIRRRPEEK